MLEAPEHDHGGTAIDHPIKLIIHHGDLYPGHIHNSKYGPVIHYDGCGCPDDQHHRTGGRYDEHPSVINVGTTVYHERR